MSTNALAISFFDTSDTDTAKQWRETVEKNRDESISYLALGRRAAHQELNDAISSKDFEPVDLRSVRFAIELIEALPWWAPSPEVSVDPDGEILLDWDYGVRSVFSVGISPYGKLSFAGLFGASTRSGAQTFTGEIPKAILEGIDEVAGDAAERLA